MFKKLIIGAVVTGMLVSLVGCGNSSSSQQPTQQKQAQSSQLPPGHPGIGTTGNSAATTNATVTPAQVEKQINDVLAKDFPGDWKVSGSNLSKGSYVENNNYKIVDKIAAEIPNTISASIFVDKKRIATSMVVGGKRQLDYEISDQSTIDSVLKSGKLTTINGGSYVKIYLPLKSGDKTVAVMTVSVGSIG